MAQPYFKYYQISFILRTNNLFGTGLFGTAAGFSCVRLLAPHYTAIVQSSASFTSHDVGLKIELLNDVLDWLDSKFYNLIEVWN